MKKTMNGGALELIAIDSVLRRRASEDAVSKRRACVGVVAVSIADLCRRSRDAVRRSWRVATTTRMATAAASRKRERSMKKQKKKKRKR